MNACAVCTVCIGAVYADNPVGTNGSLNVHHENLWRLRGYVAALITCT